ncbi:MAG TPA: hypothetical protein VGR43_04420 [Dehalococcoidia bacterium]|jgi:hypothetical protein|nr:hypothetical protein [Dehalococcoidia bacterium]
MVNRISRRRFLSRAVRVSAGLSLAAALPPALAACSDDESAPQSGVGTATPEQAQAEAKVLVGDVLDFRLVNDDGWRWGGGWVTMRLHEALFNGEKVYHVRTDSSDRAFGEAEKLVYVPKLGSALNGGVHSEIYLFEDGVRGQSAVVGTVPGEPDFTPLFRVINARWSAEPQLLHSAEGVREAASSGALQLETTGVIVNYPFVKWPGGELPADPRLEKALDGGPLISAPDLDALTVTFKLHQCYPESYYIITDTGAVPMAGMMNVVAAPGASSLVEAGATEKIYVFGNGLAGFAAMGFQPSIFASKAGELSWSPMWEHVTVMWNDGVTPELLSDSATLAEREKAAQVKMFPGTPDTGGQSFVVNCPAPITAPNTFKANA